MILEAKQLTQTFGSHVAVNGLNLQIARGSFTALLGPNGAGKSTTMNLLIGLTQPTAGQVIYGDEARIGVVFLSSVLYVRLTVGENLQIRARQYRHVAPNKVAEVSTELGLNEFICQRYGTLSGGQKRRVDIARALLNDPDILFLDEPTTGLDIQTRSAIWKLLQRLQQARQLTIVLTTHYLDEADAADNVYVIDQGKLVATGTATAIKARYAKAVLQLTTRDVEQLRERVTVRPTQCRGNQLTFTVPNSQVALDILTVTRDLITTFEFRPGTMDDAFLALTGKEMR